MATPSWLPVAISSVGVILALCAFMWQIHRARFNQSVDLLFRLENDFFGPGKKLQRVEASKDLLRGEVLEAEPILDFFETMALLLRRGALDKEMVWHTFFYWVDHYYEAAHTSIIARQTIDPQVWRDLGPFVEELRAMQKTRAGKFGYHPPDTAQIAAFLAEEQTEAT